MTYEIATAAIGAAGGAITAGIALLTPWPKWGVEKRRLDRKRKAALLKSWREGLARMEGHDKDEYIATEWYESMRPYMWENRRAQLERQRTMIVPADSGRGIKDLFAREIDRIEQSWGLRPKS